MHTSTMCVFLNRDGTNRMLTYLCRKIYTWLNLEILLYSWGCFQRSHKWIGINQIHIEKNKYLSLSIITNCVCSLDEWMLMSALLIRTYVVIITAITVNAVGYSGMRRIIDVRMNSDFVLNLFCVARVMCIWHSMLAVDCHITSHRNMNVSLRWYDKLHSLLSHYNTYAYTHSIYNHNNHNHITHVNDNVRREFYTL